MSTMLYLLKGNQTCPTSQVCHNISYYVYPFTFHSNKDITLIFLKGQHILNGKLYIFGVNRVTLKGQDQWIYDNHRLTWNDYLSATVVIGTGTIYITETTSVYIEGFTFINGVLWISYISDILVVQYLYIHSISQYSVSLITYSHHITIINNTYCMRYQVYFYLYSSSNTIHNLTVQGVYQERFLSRGALSLILLQLQLLM